LTSAFLSRRAITQLADRNLAIAERRVLEHLTTPSFVGMKSNMDAELLFRKRLGFSETAFVEMVIWQVSKPVHGSARRFKYRLALVAECVCVLRYDNQAGKGDHKHIGEREAAYRFTDLDQLQAVFWQDVGHWREKQ
jgi:hypothetical protein